MYSASLACSSIVTYGVAFAICTKSALVSFIVVGVEAPFEFWTETVRTRSPRRNAIR